MKLKAAHFSPLVFWLETEKQENQLPVSIEQRTEKGICTSHYYVMPARELLAAPELEPFGTVKSIKFLQMQGQPWSVEFSNGSVKETVRMETSAEEMQEILSKSSI